MSANDYLDSQIQEYKLKIAALEEEKNKISSLPDDYKEFKVGCSENNSGGYFWLTTEDYKGLVREGFTVFPKNRTFYKVASARTEDEAIMMVKADFNSATTFDADDEGCNCCGRPFYFHVDDEFYWETHESGSSDLRKGILL